MTKSIAAVASHAALASFPIFYDASNPLTSVKINFAQWSMCDRNPIQRNEKLRLDKPHLQKLMPAHSVIAVAVLPSGKMFKVDGHSRFQCMQDGKLTTPVTFQATVYSVETMREVEELYECYDNLSAAKTGADSVQSALSKFGIEAQTPWIKNGKFASAISLATKMWHAACGLPVSPKLMSHYDRVRFFEGAIKLLDQIDGEKSRFPLAVTAAALLAFQKYGARAMPFFKTYNTTSGLYGTLGTTERDMVAMLHEFFRDQRAGGKMSGFKQNDAQLAKALTLFEYDLGTPGKMLLIAPAGRTVAQFLTA